MNLFKIIYTHHCSSASAQSFVRHEGTLNKVVTEDDNNLYVKPSMDYLVKEELFKMDPYKAPGLDGLGALLFLAKLKNSPTSSLQKC